MKRGKLAGLVLCFGLTDCVVADMDSQPIYRAIAKLRHLVVFNCIRTEF
ncbi:TPA: hypothetical protein ACJIK4_000711 [Kluyvera cryocrescens]